MLHRFAADSFYVEQSIGVHFFLFINVAGTILTVDTVETECDYSSVHMGV